MKKFAIHIHLFLTSKETELVAYNNLKKLKKGGHNIIITSPKPLPDHFYEVIDFFFFDRENQLFEFSYDDVHPTVHWFATAGFTMNFVVQKVQPHALAVLRSMIKGCQVAKMVGFDYIIRFEYDDLFGKESIKKLENLALEILDKDLDFYLYKNDYGQDRSDISVHLMFYKPDSFLSVFESIKNETDYNIFLNNFGIPKKAILLEEFMWLCLKGSQMKIEYKSGQEQFLEFPDTGFNMRQIDNSTKNGILSDVMLIKTSNGYEKDKICIAVHNQSCEDDVDVYFSIFDSNQNLINVFKTSIWYLGQWYYHIIDNCDNIGFIKIKQNDGDFYKEIIVNKKEDRITIKDSAIVGYENFSYINFN